MKPKRGNRSALAQRDENEPDPVDETLIESFPASDPPAWTSGREARDNKPPARKPSDTKPR